MLRSSPQATPAQTHKIPDKNHLSAEYPFKSFYLSCPLGIAGASCIMRLGRLAAILMAAEVAVFFAYVTRTSEPAEMTPELYCILFGKVRDNLSANFGARVDSVTQLEGVDVICDQKTLVFRHNVKLQRPQIDEKWVAQRKRRWTKSYCNRHPAFSNAIRDGWTITTVLTLADGAALRIDAKCHDAEA
jgi:hypothetical protein